MANPADMTDEEINKVISTGVEPEDQPKSDESEEPEAPSEEPKEAPKETPKESEDKEPEANVEDEEKGEKVPPSRRETLRIQQLLKKYGPPQERPITPSTPAQREGAIDYQNALEADPEIIRQLEADRRAEGDSRYDAGVQATRAEIRSSEWRTLLSFDTPQTETKYPWLNPKDKVNFDPAMADAVNTEYLSVVGFDEKTGLVDKPDVRYSDFIEARVELSTRLAKAMTADTTKNIAKQAATTGLRPDGSSAKRLNLNQSPQDMSLEELYASIGQRVPDKKP